MWKYRKIQITRCEKSRSYLDLAKIHIKKSGYAKDFIKKNVRNHLYHQCYLILIKIHIKSIRINQGLLYVCYCVSISAEYGIVLFPLIFHFLIKQFFDIIWKLNEAFLDKYGMGDLKLQCDLRSKLYCAETASCTVSFTKTIQWNEKQLHSKIQQFLASNDFNSAIPNTTLKLLAQTNFN